MVNKKQNISDEAHKNQRDLQEREIKERLNHIKNKILVIPVSGGKLASHFGHCDQFAFIETKAGKIQSSEMRTPPPHEPGVLPVWLHEQGADVAIVGGMGEQAQTLLREKGIEVVIGAPVEAPEVPGRSVFNG